jgi:hypothetical protein
MIKVIYWVIVAIDLLGLGLFVLLGLAAAGSSGTSPIAAALYLLTLPTLVLGTSIYLYLRASSPALRGLAFALAAGPIALLAGGYLLSQAQYALNVNEDGEMTFFRSGPMREIAEAIKRNDAATVTSLAPQVDINEPGLSGMTLLMVAIRQLEDTPRRHDVLAALLAAGADPNKGSAYESPLQTALQLADSTGPEPVRQLLAAGADPNRVDAEGTPMWFSAIGRDASLDALALLLDAGADLQATRPSGETALIYAATAPNWHAALLLLDRGADWRQGRAFNGATFPQVVQAHIDRVRTQADFEGKPVPDDGVDNVVAFLQSRGAIP